MQGHDRSGRGGRRRQSTAWVRFTDRVARTLIIAGGIGTIAAVLLMGLFLLAVAAPLFLPPHYEPPRFLGHVGLSGSVLLGGDESGRIGWWLEPNGGVLRAFDTARGTVLVERHAGAWLDGCTVVRTLPGRAEVAAGFADGSVRLGRVGVETSFVEPDQLPAAATGVPPGEVFVAGDAILLRGPAGQWSRAVMVLESTGTSAASGEAVTDVDLAVTPAGTIVAALSADGTVHVETTTARRNLLGARPQSSRATAVIPAPTDGFHPAFVRVSEMGDQLFLIARDGRGRRHAIRPEVASAPAEMFAALPDAATVTAVCRLYGGQSLVVGDSQGGVHVLFAVRAAGASAADGLATTIARTIAAPRDGRAIVALCAAPRSRLFAAADAGGGVRLLQATSGATVLDVPPSTGRTAAVAIGPRDDLLLGAGVDGVWSCVFDPGFPEVSPRSLLAPVWYENYPAAVHAWETTGHESFEPKFGFVPLVFGTLKATLYSMLFATPVAILAAIYSSQFMHPRWKGVVKPAVEMLASLPSVVLGFVAGLVFAPMVDRGLPLVMAALFTGPLALVVGAHVWQLLPSGTRVRVARWRFVLVTLVALPAAWLAAGWVAPWAERFLFAGDLRAWLEGGDGGGVGGWSVTLLPLAAVVTAWGIGRWVHPVLRRSGGGWSPRQAALMSLAVLVLAIACALALAVAAGVFLDSLRFDPRGGLLGSYVQRNALVVAFGMGFAIIPLVFTIAEDALSSVPEHLRSASLGAGATVWQTTMRVVMPTAASGLFSAVMIGLGRAVGETMIVLMAAGNTPIIDWNLFNGFQTLSAAIATELPEAARGSAHYRVLFLAALTLFALTFVVNTAAEVVRQRFRRRAHEL